MEWQQLALESVADWVFEHQLEVSAPPPGVAFAPLDFQRDVAGQILDQLDIAGDIQSRSGTVRLHSDDPDGLWAAALRYLELTRLPRELESDVDEPPAFVQRESTTRIEGVPSIGPGGRITQYAFGASDFVDVSIRPVAVLTAPGQWRDPLQVLASAADLVKGMPEHELSVAFGYSEPSAYEAADRAVAVYLLRMDGTPSDAGPRWQRCIEIPADGTLPIDDWEM